MRKVHYRKSFVAALAFTALFLGLQAQGGTQQDGVWLVMPEEAAMPSAVDPGRRSRGLPRSENGPIIEVLKPVVNEPISVPTEITVQFSPRRAPVNVTSLKVTLLKLINLDITDRVRPYTSSTGIHIPNAKLPSGQHDLRITLADDEGNSTNKLVSLTIP